MSSTSGRILRARKAPAERGGGRPKAASKSLSEKDKSECLLVAMFIGQAIDAMVRHYNGVDQTLINQELKKIINEGYDGTGRKGALGHFSASIQQQRQIASQMLYPHPAIDLDPKRVFVVFTPEEDKPLDDNQKYTLVFMERLELYETLVDCVNKHLEKAHEENKDDDKPKFRKRNLGSDIDMEQEVLDMYEKINKCHVVPFEQVFRCLDSPFNLEGSVFVESMRRAINNVLKARYPDISRSHIDHLGFFSRVRVRLDLWLATLACLKTLNEADKGLGPESRLTRDGPNEEKAREAAEKICHGALKSWSGPSDFVVNKLSADLVDLRQY